MHYKLILVTRATVIWAYGQSVAADTHDIPSHPWGHSAHTSVTLSPRLDVYKLLQEKACVPSGELIDPQHH